jgi:hypothetical protein
MALRSPPPLPNAYGHANVAPQCLFLHRRTSTPPVAAPCCHCRTVVLLVAYMFQIVTVHTLSMSIDNLVSLLVSTSDIGPNFLKFFYLAGSEIFDKRIQKTLSLEHV